MGNVIVDDGSYNEASCLNNAAGNNGLSANHDHNDRKRMMYGEESYRLDSDEDDDNDRNGDNHYE